jgi:hypothetical protein
MAGVRGVEKGRRMEEREKEVEVEGEKEVEVEVKKQGETGCWSARRGRMTRTKGMGEEKEETKEGERDGTPPVCDRAVPSPCLYVCPCTSNR